MSPSSPLQNQAACSKSFDDGQSMGATIVASDTAPVREVMTHGKTALLVDFHDHDALARQVIEVLARPGDYAPLGVAARRHMVETYDFRNQCLPEHIARINSLVPKALAIPMR